MADTVAVTAGSGTTISTEEVTTLNGSTVTAQHLQRVAVASRTADGTAVDIIGDSTYGLDVDVTRSALPSGASTAALQTTGNSSLSDIKTAVETLDNTVSGSELQVDVVSDPALSSTTDSVAIYGSDDGGTTKRIIKTDSGGAIQVDLEVASVAVTSIAAGDNNIGNVDVATIAAGNNNIGDVDVATVPAPLSTTGGGTEATALRVTLASDSTGVISVDDNAGTLTTDGSGVAGTPAGGVLTVQGVTSMTPIQVGDNATTLSVDDGAGALTVDGTVAVSSVGGTVAVTQSGTWDEVGINDSGNSITVDNGGTFAVQAASTIADGADVTLGAKADAKSTATDTTAISAMSVLKEISYMEQNPASRAVTNAGTFAVQESGAALTALQLIDNAVSGAGFNVTQFAGAAVPIGAGTEAAALRVTIATDDPVNDAAVELAAAIDTEVQCDIVGALPAGTNAIGKLAANSGIDIGDVDVTSITNGSINGPGVPVVDSYTHASINLAAGANQVLVSSSVSHQIWVYGIGFTVNAAGTVSFQDEDDTAITGIMPIAANGGMVVAPSGNFAMPIWKLATDKDLEVDVVTSELDGWIDYAIVNA